MKCTNKEQETCDVEKMGCAGCAYNDNEKVIKELVELENKINQLSRDNNLHLEIGTMHAVSTVENKDYTRVAITAYKELK